MSEFSRREFLTACTLGGAAAAAGPGSARQAAAASERAAPPETRWNRTYSTGSDDEAVAVAARPDGEGFALAGTTAPGGGAGTRMWLFAVDRRGEKQWERTYEFEAETVAHDLTATGDGYVVAGTTRSSDKPGQRGAVVKVATEGTEVWRRKYEFNPDSTDELRAVASISGGLLFGGWTKPLDDGWVVKTDGDGDVVWQDSFDEGGDDRFYTATAADDEGYFFAGDTDAGSSNDRRGLAVELTPEGEKKFSQRFRVKTDDLTNQENNRNAFRDVVKGNTGYLLVGDTAKRRDANARSAWAVKINGFGSKEWQREVSVATFNRFYGVVSDGLNFYAAGETAANRDRDNRRGMLAKLGLTGDLLWTSSYTARDSSAFADMARGDDDGLVPAGGAEPSYGSADEAAWAVKVGGDPVSTPTPSPTPTPTPTPTDTPTPTPTASPTPTPTDAPTTAPGTTPPPTGGGSGLTTTQPPATPTTTAASSDESGSGFLVPFISGGLLVALLGAGAYLYSRSRGEPGGAPPAEGQGHDSGPGPGPAPGTEPGGPGQGGQGNQYQGDQTEDTPADQPPADGTEQSADEGQSAASHDESEGGTDAERTDDTAADADAESASTAGVEDDEERR